MMIMIFFSAELVLEAICHLLIGRLLDDTSNRRPVCCEPMGDWALSQFQVIHDQTRLAKLGLTIRPSPFDCQSLSLFTTSSWLTSCKKLLEKYSSLVQTASSEAPSRVAQRLGHSLIELDSVRHLFFQPSISGRRIIPAFGRQREE